VSVCVTCLELDHAQLTESFVIHPDNVSFVPAQFTKAEKF